MDKLLSGAELCPDTKSELWKDAFVAAKCRRLDKMANRRRCRIGGVFILNTNVVQYNDFAFYFHTSLFIFFEYTLHRLVI